MDLATQAKIQELRNKSLTGQLTMEELKEAVRLMRGDRASAVRNSNASRAKMAKAAIPDADDMLGELAK